MATRKTERNPVAPRRTKTKSSRAPRSVIESLTTAAAKLEGSHLLRPGEVVLHLTGHGGGTFRATHADGRLEVREATHFSSERPLLEVFADAQVVQQILAGEKDAVKEFLAGDIRIRGDLHFFSSVALELKLIKRPL